MLKKYEEKVTLKDIIKEIKEILKCEKSKATAEKLIRVLVGDDRQDVLKMIGSRKKVEYIVRDIAQSPQGTQDVLDTINALQETVFKYSLLKDFSTLFLPAIGLIIEKYSSVSLKIILPGEEEPFYEVCGAIIAIVGIGIICCYVSKSWREEDKCKFYICLLKTKLERELEKWNGDQEEKEWGDSIAEGIDEEI